VSTNLPSNGAISLTFISVLCGEYAIKRIDEPFVTEKDDLSEWAL
jgi:hypothetical protein